MTATKTTKRKSRSIRGVAKTYGSYNFIDKDPVFDELRTIVELYAKVVSMTFNGVLKEIADSSGVSYGCMVGWFYGRTITPKFANLQRVANALGKSYYTKNYDGEGTLRGRPQ